MQEEMEQVSCEFYKKVLQELLNINNYTLTFAANHEGLWIMATKPIWSSSIWMKYRNDESHKVYIWIRMNKAYIEIKHNIEKQGRK